MTVQEQIIVYVVLLGAVAVSSFYFYKRLEELEEKNNLLTTEIQKQGAGIHGMVTKVNKMSDFNKPIIQQHTQPTHHDVPPPTPTFTTPEPIEPNTSIIMPGPNAAPAAAPQYDQPYEPAPVFE